MHFIHADRVIAGPLAIVEAVAERKGALVKCSADGQGKILEMLNVEGGL
jgi:hypothetical protein